MTQEQLNTITNLNKSNIWIPKHVSLQLTLEQYNAMLKGYQLNWDMRYGLFYNKFDNYFYLYRSEFIVGKYKFELPSNDIYICTEMYENPEKIDFMVIFESIREACRFNNIEISLDKLSEMFRSTEELNCIK